MFYPVCSNCEEPWSQKLIREEGYQCGKCTEEMNGLKLRIPKHARLCPKRGPDAAIPLGKEEEKERMKRLAPQFLDLLKQYAKDPGLLEGLEGACVAIVDQEVRTLEDKLEAYERQLRVDMYRFTDPTFKCVWLDAADDIDRTLSSLPTF